MSTIAERVAAGAAWLDEHRSGWVDRVDLETLDLGDPCHCVIGQCISPAYWDRDPEDGLDLHAEYLRGFYEDGWLSDQERDYRVLTDEWRRYITERRAS